MPIGAGAIPKPIVLTKVRPLERSDLAELREPRAKDNVVARFRDPHLRLARLIASGLRLDEAAARAGYSYNRASILRNDPAFEDLVTKYRARVDEAFVEEQTEFHQLATSNMLKAERMIAETLDQADENEELLPVRTLISISRDAADRFGYGKKDTRLNINVDFAAKLEATIARSTKSPRVIESSVVSSNDGCAPAPQTLTRQEHSPPDLIPVGSHPSVGVPIRRRA